jgi:hypothetical protein
VDAAGAAGRRGPREELVMDFVFVGIAIGFFALTIGFARLCERL